MVNALLDQSVFVFMEIEVQYKKHLKKLIESLQSLDKEEQVDALNEIKIALHEASPFCNEPVELHNSRRSQGLRKGLLPSPSNWILERNRPRTRRGQQRACGCGPSLSQGRNRFGKHGEDLSSLVFRFHF